MASAVLFQSVSKRYPRGGQGNARYASLRHDLTQLGRRRAPSTPGRSSLQGTLALDDVSFDVKEGESFALIGPNGAGKTTALKLISRISPPTAGEIRLRGRVAALMEVGSGVHPELTGRENIWLYGQILGMRKPEVRRRFDEIIHFSEVEHAIDTPVKFYSSGMQLRLGFSIAAFLNPDIFVVDEALAVGDAAFQTKCVDRMTDLVKEGRTLLFVSHNLFMVESVCSRAVLLLEGKAVAVGDVTDVLGRYINIVDEGLRARRHVGEAIQGAGVDLLSVSLHASDGGERYVFTTGDSLDVKLRLRGHRAQRGCRVSIGISDGRQGPLVLCSMLEAELGVDLDQSDAEVLCRIKSLPLAPRTYDIWASVRDETGTVEVVPWSQVGVFRVGELPEGSGVTSATVPWLAGPVRVEHGWLVGP